MKQFKGLCSKCGKYGHKHADCGKNGTKKQEIATIACSKDKNSLEDGSFDELGFVTGCEGVVQPSRAS